MYIWYTSNAFSTLIIKKINSSHESFWPYFDYIIRNVYHCCYFYYRVTDNRCDYQTRLDGQRNRRQGNLRKQNSTIEERYCLSVDYHCYVSVLLFSTYIKICVEKLRICTEKVNQEYIPVHYLNSWCFD